MSDRSSTGLPLPYVDDVDFRLYVGDVRLLLAQMPESSIDCCVTSPPYWGLRDYGTGTWIGGDEECQHRVGGQVQDTKAKGAIVAGVRPGVDATRCLDCGAVREDQQLGLERTPGEYVEAMVAVFREVRRVLKPEGTLWLNLGDSYNAYNGGAGPGSKLSKTQTEARPRLESGFGLRSKDLKPKDLVGIPWRVALALQEDAWYLRSDIVWFKPNPMPESIRDRPTKAHEYVFLFAKEQRYYFDQDAVREPATYAGKTVTLGPKSLSKGQATGMGREPSGNGTAAAVVVADGRNIRSVWPIQTQPYPEAHFATFPIELPRRCILAGCPAGGVVLDPFMGSGTTALAARGLGRNAVGIELNPEYAALCARRLGQQSLLAEGAA